MPSSKCFRYSTSVTMVEEIMDPYEDISPYVPKIEQIDSEGRNEPTETKEERFAKRTAAVMKFDTREPLTKAKRVVHDEMHVWFAEERGCVFDRDSATDEILDMGNPLLGNGQTGIPRFPLNPSGIKPRDDSVTPLIKGSSMDPIPPHSHGHPVCSEEIVACSSELTVDDDGAARTRSYAHTGDIKQPFPIGIGTQAPDNSCTSPSNQSFAMHSQR